MKIETSLSAICTVFIASMLIGVTLGVVVIASTPSFPTVYEQGSMVTEYDYIIFMYSGVWYARNGLTGEIEYSSDSSSVITYILTQFGAEGGVIYDQTTKQVIDLRKTHVVVGDNVLMPVIGVPTNLITNIGAGRVSLIWFAIASYTDNYDGVLTFSIDGYSSSMDMGTYLCYHYANALPSNVNYSAAHQGASLGETGGASTGWNSYPINYRDSFYLNYTPVTATNGRLYWSVYYQVFDDNPISTRVKGTDFTGSTIANTLTLDILDETGPGRLLGINLVLDGTSYNVLENDINMYINGELLQSTGTEDYFLGGWYFEASRFYDADQFFAGMVCWDTAASVGNFYRDFLAQHGGLGWTDSFSLEYQNTECGYTVGYSYCVWWDTY